MTAMVLIIPPHSKYVATLPWTLVYSTPLITLMAS